MNKLNGGYVMVNGSSSTLQADLKKAYETGRPVLYYKDNKAYYADVKKKGDKYFAYCTTYDHPLLVEGTNGDNETFSIPFHCNVLNYEEIEYSDLTRYLEFTLCETDENDFNGSSYEILYGQFGMGLTHPVYKAPDNAVKYDDFNFDGATDATITNF